MAKRFWLGMDHRNGLKRTDKLMVGNIDNQAAEFIDLSELLSALTSDDLPEGLDKLFLTPLLKQKLESIGGSNYTLAQLAQYFYPVDTNPEGFLTSESGLAAAKIVGALAVAQIPGLDAGNIISGILGAARIPDLPASKITSGEFAVERIPVLPASKFEGIAVELGKYILKTTIGAANGVAGLDANVKLPVGYIPNMDAAKITTGVFPEGRIPDVFVRLTQLVDYYSKTETQAFTSDEKNKLAGLEGPKWKGGFLTPAALRADYPEGEGQIWHNNEGGWTADVDAGVGQLLQRYIWDASDLVWREQASGTGSDSAAQVKSKYESNPDTNVFSDINKTKVEGLPATVESTTGAQAKADAAKTAAQNYGDLRGDGLENRILANENNKVDKDGTKVLTDENYSLAEKNKLAAVEDPKWKGNYPTIEALRVDYPEGAGQVWHQDKGGWIGDVDAGVNADVTRYIWDASDLKWVIQAGASTSETAASIKTKYESNLDTNAFTDALLDKLISITAIFTTALKTSYDTAASWVSTNGQNVLAHVTKFTNNTPGQIPVSQADGSIVWEAKPTGGTSDTTNLAKLDQSNTFTQPQNFVKLNIEDLGSTNPRTTRIKANPNSTAAGWASKLLFGIASNGVIYDMLELIGSNNFGNSKINLNADTKINGSLNVTGDFSIPKLNLARTNHEAISIGQFSKISGYLRTEGASNPQYVTLEAFMIGGSGWATGIRFKLRDGGRSTAIPLELYGSGYGAFSVKTNSLLQILGGIDLSALGEYTDDAAAASGGVPVGQGYINSTTGALHKRRT